MQIGLTASGNMGQFPDPRPSARGDSGAGILRIVTGHHLASPDPHHTLVFFRQSRLREEGPAPPTRLLAPWK